MNKQFLLVEDGILITDNRLQLRSVINEICPSAGYTKKYYLK